MNLNSVLERAAVAVPSEPGDYIENGLLFCGQCHTAKQCRVSIPGGHGFVTSCLCACGVKARDSEREQRHKVEERDRLERMRSVGVQNQVLRQASFSADDGKNPGPMQTARRYAEQWEEMRASNCGLLFYGGCGSGKSFAAACIANYLVDNGVSALMLNTAEVLSKMGDFETGNEWLENVMRYQLVVLDDLGAERQTEYAMEMLFRFVDARYRSRRPMLCTTNLTLVDLRNPSDLVHGRIFDRVLEMTVPVGFGSDSRRKELGAEKFAQAKKFLTG